MTLPFLDRTEEKARLNRALSGPAGNLVCLYGRRRCGKSRLLLEALKSRRAVYYVGDDREARLQRRSLARAIGVLLDGFDRVEYPDWDALLERWFREAPAGSVLALDEFPAMVKASRDLPSLIQKQMDRPRRAAAHCVLCGSSQRMMQGLVLDAAAPLYGRAREIMRIRPLGAHWIASALKLKNAAKALEAYGVWGGVPLYWERAREYGSHWEAVAQMALDPLGPLHEEPRRLLMDDGAEIAQPASILSLVAGGCHRVSEIAARLGKPSSSLARPIQRLLELELLKREQPYGAPERDNKKSLYKIADPFLQFWYRFVEPNRSCLQAGQVRQTLAEIRKDYPAHLGGIWEDLARASVARMEIAGRRWRPAARWWGSGLDRKPMELDIVAQSEDGGQLIVGEAKLLCEGKGRASIEAELLRKIELFPLAEGKPVIPCIWSAYGSKTPAQGVPTFTAEEVFGVLR
ncbi:MAG: ATP-binding protein [Candidatus Sumerlaeota bacterium]|nr:ATP-binding protein [Candidatus Sumerlaeota bacterium]